MSELKTDLESHRIEGWTKADHPGGGEAGQRISMDLISHIEGNLWQGGCIPGVHLPEDFEFVVSMYPWGQYVLGPTTRRLEFEMYDSSEMQPLDSLLVIARSAQECVRQGKTLIHCQAGLNRSGLITALVLMLGGKTAKEAIALQRAQRGELVLCNTHFERFLLDLHKSDSGWRHRT